MTRILLALVLLQAVPTPLLVRTGVVIGRVRLDDGTPVGGVRVAVSPVTDTAQGDSVLESISVTDGDGRYRLDNVAPGRYHVVVIRNGVEVYSPGVVDAALAAIMEVRATSTVAAPDIVFVQTKVSGRVVDAATGAPRKIEKLSLCCLFLPAQLGGRSPRASTVPISATVRDDGSFVFPDVPPGNHYLYAADPATIALGLPLRVGDREVTDLEVKVSTGVNVRGRIVDRLGTPVAAISLRLRAQNLNNVFDVSGTSSASGGGTVVGPPGGSVSPPSAQEVLTRLSGFTKHRTTLPDSDGTFEFNRVMPGSFVLETNTTGTEILRQEINVGPEGVFGVRVQLQATLLSGRVLTQDGKELPSLKGAVRLSPAAEDSRAVYAFPDDEGRFTVLLPPGEYRVSADALGPTVQSVSDGTTDLMTSPLRFDGLTRKEVHITLD